MRIHQDNTWDAGIIDTVPLTVSGLPVFSSDANAQRPLHDDISSQMSRCATGAKSSAADPVWDKEYTGQELVQRHFKRGT